MNNLPDKPLSEQLEEIIMFFKVVLRNYYAENKKTNNYNNKIQDLLHDLELTEGITYHQIAKIGKQIREVRLERRDSKDDFLLLEPVVNFIKGYDTLINDLISCKKMVKETEDKLTHRVYFQRDTSETKIDMHYKPDDAIIIPSQPPERTYNTELKNKIKNCPEAMKSIDILDKVFSKFYNRSIISVSETEMTIDIKISDSLRNEKAKALHWDIYYMFTDSAYHVTRLNSSDYFIYMTGGNLVKLPCEVTCFNKDDLNNPVYTYRFNIICPHYVKPSKNKKGKKR